MAIRRCKLVKSTISHVIWKLVCFYTRIIIQKVRKKDGYGGAIEGYKNHTNTGEKPRRHIFS